MGTRSSQRELGVAVWALLLASTLVGGASTRPLAVLVASETEARSADSALAPRALPEPLPAGVEVDLLEERAGWARIPTRHSRRRPGLRHAVRRPRKTRR